MEEEALSNPNDTSDKTLDPIAQRKHAAMLERLSNLQQSRVQQSLSRKSNSDSFESTQSFLSRFAASKHSIESELTRCRQITDSDSKHDLKSHLEKLSISISDLEKLVAENSYFLPSYEVRTCLKTICELKQTVDNVSSEVVPKKRFAFKNKQTKKAATNALDEPEPEPEPETRDARPQRTGFKVRDSPGFRVKENEVLVKEFRDSEIGEFTISDLNGCEVRLTGCLRALFVHRLRNCKIRIHHARGSDFYLRVRSRPIIEDSGDVRFAPYCLCYDGIERDLKESNLDEETGNWANVDDFRWLRAVQSPNWSILLESERLHTVDISESEI
ncbi:hypothetical protein F0562_003266 [Nyssa sinensis]|uniref:C-CAP/cofactor C-like domain-containing protein n=1 Tax=Nyssa sinensis TaxID=561372 RepID=A0A5J5BXW8_9ASTE|nr:hypothetical protein F0562_003266 [Nyssa sinensis]